MKLNSIEKKEYCLLSAMLLAAFLVMFCLTTLTPMVADDYDYSYSMSTGLRVDSLYEIRQTIRMHWKGLNGRFFSHIFAYYFLWQPKALFNFANALVAAVLVLFAYRSIRLASPSHAFFYTVTWCMLVFCFIPVFGQVFLWLDGACNYSWGLAWNLIYLFPFLSFWFDKRSRRHLLPELLLLADAFLAGSYNETISLSFLCLTFLILLVSALKKRGMDAVLILHFLFAFGGFLFLILAPGSSNHMSSLSAPALLKKVGAFLSVLPTAVRFGIPVLLVSFSVLLVCLRRRPKALFICSLSGILAGTLLLGYLTRPRGGVRSVLGILSKVSSSSVWGLLVLTALFLSLFVIALYRKIPGDTLLLAAMVFVSALLPLCALLLAPYIPMRQFCAYAALSSLADVLLLSVLVPDCSAKPLRFFSLFLICIFIVHFFCGCVDIIRVRQVSDVRTALLEEARHSEDGVARIPMWAPLTKYSAAYGLDDVKDHPIAWPNTTMRDYYGVTDVIGYYE